MTGWQAIALAAAGFLGSFAGTAVFGVHRDQPPKPQPRHAPTFPTEPPKEDHDA